MCKYFKFGTVQNFVFWRSSESRVEFFQLFGMLWGCTQKMINTALGMVLIPKYLHVSHILEPCYRKRGLNSAPKKYHLMSTCTVYSQRRLTRGKSCCYICGICQRQCHYEFNTVFWKSSIVFYAKLKQVVPINSLPNDKILHQSKFKAFADDKIKVSTE